MLIVGLNGGFAKLKNTVLSAFSFIGIKFINMDELAYKIIEKYFHKILNRSILRSIIFKNSNFIKCIINKHLISLLKKIKSTYILLVSPILFETYQYKLLDRILIIDLSCNITINRIILRDYNINQSNLRIFREQLIFRADDILNTIWYFTNIKKIIINLDKFYCKICYTKLIFNII
ncbi:Dephospho-CoA kinase [Candidatus Johnevansia muelleri]|uniref:Dephospho-CoA kinase n=1 Tax=Candidatus Johnevansia muelleri TaxID=1495769 RepID=A0A078KEI7_9GAMM|nr:Dephospho-CoA kinase [Candidatus Evansia muelleri]